MGTETLFAIFQGLSLLGSTLLILHYTSVKSNVVDRGACSSPLIKPAQSTMVWVKHFALDMPPLRKKPSLVFGS